MQVILVVDVKKKKTHLMFKLVSKKSIDTVKKLVRELKCSQAISGVLSCGTFIKELAEDELVHAESDLILTQTNAYWSLM